MDKIENEICNALDSIIDLCLETKGNKSWTKEIKRAFLKLGSKYGYETCSSGIEESNNAEWLYDLVWYNNYETNYIKNVFLVLECEWNIDFPSIKYDFEKLILAKAKYRVMIFQGRNEEKVKEVINDFKEIIKGCEMSVDGDKYLFEGYVINMEMYICESYIFKDK